MSQLSDTDLEAIRAIRVIDGEVALRAVQDWLTGRDAAQWHPWMLGEFQRGYDTAVEEVRVALAQGDIKP